MSQRQIAMPLFTTASAVRSADVLRNWMLLFPNGPKLTVVKAPGDVDEYAIDGREIFVAWVGAPVPNDEALHAVRYSWMWQGPDDAVRTHAGHAIVTASGEEIVAAWDVARLCAALLASGTGAALYWGASRQVHMAKLAIDFVSKRADDLPVPLFVGITISGESKEGPFAAATHGLETLGHKEFEVHAAHMGIGDLRMTLLDLAAYVLAEGPVLLDGQTFGPSAEVEWSIKHAPSTLVEGRDAIVLGIP